jgi:hypothetical protein
MKTNWWYESGLAAQAAQDLVWFIVLVFVGIGLLIWRDMRNEGKQQDKSVSNGNVRKGDKK